MIDIIEGDDKMDLPSEPLVIVVMGAVKAGKTTFIERYIKDRAVVFDMKNFFINLDMHGYDRTLILNQNIETRLRERFLELLSEASMTNGVLVIEYFGFNGMINFVLSEFDTVRIYISTPKSVLVDRINSMQEREWMTRVDAFAINDAIYSRISRGLYHWDVKYLSTDDVFIPDFDIDVLFS